MTKIDVDETDLKELLFAVRRLLEDAEFISPGLVLVDRLDYDRLNVIMTSCDSFHNVR